MPYTLEKTTYVNADWSRAVPGESSDARWVLGGPGKLIEDAMAEKLGLAKSAVPEPTGTPLPEDFPAADVLVRSGITTVEALQEVGDLTEISGIGPALSKEINAALAQLVDAATPEAAPVGRIIEPEVRRAKS